MRSLTALLLTFVLTCVDANHLRASRNEPRQLDDADRNYCYCEGCTADVLAELVDGHTCGNRISWLQSSRSYTEVDACRRVAGDEFDEDCQMCNPHTCQVEKLCGDIPTCTVEALEAMACDSSLGGCYQCGERIKYLISNGVSNAEACHQITVEEFPDECGRCSAAQGPTNVPTPRPTPRPSPRPSSSYSLQPPSLSPVNTQYRCETSTCTAEVLETMACDASLGGCYTCGSRIDYFINDLGYSEVNACEVIAYAQFPSICGACLPEYLRMPVAPVDESQLIWSDEFDYEGSPDPSKWSYDIGTGSWGWGNNELQYYTDRLDNVYAENGILRIRALREDYQGSAYTSARIKTKFQGDWTYGRIQVRSRLVYGTARGTWAAAWMLSTDDKYNGWPDSGEIDIMEHVGYDTGRIHGTVHTAAFNHMIGTQDGGQILTDTSDWRIHEIIWDEEKIEFILDDFVYHTFLRRDEATYAEWPFDERFHLILNMAVGGSWGGVEGVDEAAFLGDGQIMEVDWVRVYSS